MRRGSVPVSLESPCQGPNKEGSIASESLAQCKAMEPWRFLAGRGRSPGGPYNLSRRGSILRRSTFIQDSRYLPHSQ
jgi:hypothetical protein